jgi:hypothetical protein
MGGLDRQLVEELKLRLPPETRQYLQKSDHALVVAEELLAHGHLPDAASKI